MTAYQTVAAPLGFGPKRAPGGSRTRLSTVAKWCLDRSATGASATQSARAEGVEPSACGLEPHCSPRSTPLFKSCQGRTRTCSHPVNSGPLYPLSYKAKYSIRMAGFEPAFSSTPSWRIARLSYILSDPEIRDAGRSRTCFRSGCSRPPGRPAPASSRNRAGGGTRTHLVRVTRAVLGPSSITGLMQQPVLVSSQLDRGSKPQSPPEGLAKSRSCRSRTCQPGFVGPALGAARQPPLPHARVELANRPSEGQCL